MFRKALNELRTGQCSEDSAKFLTSLQRSLEVDLSKEATHIYFRKILVLIHNIHEVNNMPGQMISFDCRESGSCDGISCPALQKLLLKPNCKVMLVWKL